MTRPTGTSTIYALSSGAGRAAIAVIRMSGPGTRQALLAVAGRIPDARRARLAKLRHPQSGATLDEALILFFPAPHSFTGEDMAELQVHGSRAVVRAVLQALGALPGLTLAEPGAFTRRALENGTLDLAQVEGLGDLIDPVTERQRQQALEQFKGRLSGAVETWRRDVLDLLADLEAQLDFSDEGDVDEEACRRRVGRGLETLAGHLARALAASGRGERVRDGVTVVIAGPPNAGKSTLLNVLARRDVAIVSDSPGTTRDLLEVELDLDGFAVVLVDTAGLRDTPDPVEAEGVRRARARAEGADAVLWLSPADEPAPVPEPWQGRCLSVATKIDSHPNRSRDDRRMGISARTGQGLPELLAWLLSVAENQAGGEMSLVTRERHRLVIGRAHREIQDAADGLRGTLALELVAEHVRRAAWQLAAVVGLVEVEDVLDHLFRQFCIGK